MTGNGDILISSPTQFGPDAQSGTVAYLGPEGLLGRAAALRSAEGGRRGLRLSVSQDYRVSSIPESNNSLRYRIGTSAYRYTVLDEQERELLAWHWEPEGRGDRLRPHLHVAYGRGPAASIILPTPSGISESSFPEIDVPGRHILTGRVLLEDVIRFLIKELGVRGRDGYEAILRDNVRWFLENRTWEHFDQIADEYCDGQWQPSRTLTSRET